jgi:hypothetical protein
LNQCGEILAPAKDGATAAGAKIAATWAKQDPAAALVAVSGLPQGLENFRDRLLIAVMEQWVKQDFPAAQAAVEALPAGEIRIAAASAVIQNLIEKDHSAAFAWAKRNECDEQGSLLKTTLYQVLDKNPQSALTQFDALQAPAGIRQELAVILADRFRNDEPLTALNVLMKENITNHALDQSVERYLQASPRAASEWVQALPHGEAREASIYTLTKYLRHEDEPDFEAAFIWAQAMQASGQRDAALLDTLRSWEKLTPGAAQQALESSPLNPTERARLMEMLIKPPNSNLAPFVP